MSLNIYLTFDGNCREVVENYAELFETPVQQIMTFGDMATKDWVPPVGTENLVMHTWLDIEGAMVMFSDNTPDAPLVQGNNFSMTLIGNEEKMRAMFEKFKSQGAKVTMDLQKTEWSPLYGMVQDRFGIQWMFNTEEEKQ